MNLELDTNIQSFLKHSGDHLRKDPSIHSFILGLAGRYERSGKPISLMARGLDPQGNLITGIQTEPDRALIISNASSQGAKLFAESLSAKIQILPGVNGPSPAVDEFAKTWGSAKECTVEISGNIRLFELIAVREPPRPTGFFRMARTDDTKVIFRWLREFQLEAAPHDPRRSDEVLLQDIRECLDLGHFYIWEDQKQAVCLVGSRRETEIDRSIGPVYTPPSLRGRGYASALVAAVSERIVESGKKAVLFTDLANPTSNSIYQKIGFSPIADFKHFNFS